MIFRETSQYIFISADGSSLSCTTAEFQHCEPTYQPAVNRFWTSDKQCLNDGANDLGDPFYTPERFAGYCDKIATYTAQIQSLREATLPAPDILQVKEQRKSALNAAQKAFIYGWYDDGTQKTFLARYIRTADPRIVSVWEWIDSILPYYYSVKQAIDAAATVEDALSITWDFEQFTATKPAIALKDFYA